jgi:hypothetical protein
MNPNYVAVAERARHRCEYCHAPEALFNFPFEVEHIIPPKHGGGHTESNLALACRSCNIFKSDEIESVDPETRILVRLFDPRLDDWDDSFFVEVDSGIIRAKIAIARATIAQLRMNTPGQVTARVHWMKIGLYP